MGTRSHAALGFVLAGLIVVALIAAIGQWLAIWIPAALLSIVVGVSFIVWTIDRGIDDDAPLSEEAERQRGPRWLSAEERVGLKTALTLMAGLLAIAAVFASLAFGGGLAVIGGLVLFAWLALFGLPFWLAAIEEEADSEHRQLTGESRGNG